jgi:hypothetical protein
MQSPGSSSTLPCPPSSSLLHAASAPATRNPASSAVMNRFGFVKPELFPFHDAKER